jgi:TPR repeat protein
MVLLGTFYSTGILLERDYSAAMVWYQRAAAAGNPRAMHGVGAMYLHGWGVEKDEAKAEEWFKKATDNGYVDDKDTI